ncbi:hypothetical protein APSETT444_010333 [Aspergillus pseudonomiae]
MLDSKDSLSAEPQLKHEIEKTKDMSDTLHPSTSLHDGSMMETQDTRNGQFHRSFSPRQVHIISLGSNIGSGVFIATGQALASGGPGNMVLAYGMVCSAVWAVLQSLSEMTIAFPVSGNYIDYADRWVDPALAFGAGFAEWLAWSAIVASEAGFFNVLVQYWAEGSLPVAATVCLFVFLLPNKAFAWFEYITSIIKIFLFLLIIVLALALVLGAGPNGYVHHGETWTDLPPFLNGFTGFANCALLAVWAVGDQVFIGIMGGEAESPRFSMAHATKLVPFRVNFIYMVSIAFITILVPSNDERLLSGSGVAASPFVIAVQDAAGGLTVLNWLIAISSASFFTNWGIIAFTNWRFHCALKAQKDQLFTEGGLTFTAENFFQYTLGLWVIAGLTLAYKIIFRTPWRDPKTADCITGRRTLGAEEIMVLDRYYEQPWWRRFLTYVQLW